MEKHEKQPLERPAEGCNNNSAMYIMKTGSEGQSWLELAQNIQWWGLSVALKLWDFFCIHISKPFTVTPHLYSYYLPASWSSKLLTFIRLYN
jgi:hypothetical protein